MIEKAKWQVANSTSADNGSMAPLILSLLQFLVQREGGGGEEEEEEAYNAKEGESMSLYACCELKKPLGFP